MYAERLNKELHKNQPDLTHIHRRRLVDTSRILDFLFPLRINDPHESILQAARLMKEEKQGILIVLAPHPAIGDIPRGKIPALRNPVFREAVQLDPMAIHQAKLKQSGKVITDIADWLDINLRLVVTNRTNERYPGIWSSDDASYLFRQYMKDLMEVMKNGGLSTVYLHGDRGFMNQPPARGVLTMPYEYARRSDLLDHITLLPGFLDNAHVSDADSTLRGLEIFTPYTLHFGNPIPIRAAYDASCGLNSDVLPKNSSPLDMWAYYQIDAIRQEVRADQGKPIEQVIFQRIQEK